MTKNVTISTTVETEKGNRQKIERQIRSDQLSADLSNLSALVSQKVGEIALQEWEEEIDSARQKD